MKNAQKLIDESRFTCASLDAFEQVIQMLQLTRSFPCMRWNPESTWVDPKNEGNVPPPRKFFERMTEPYIG